MKCFLFTVSMLFFTLSAAENDALRVMSFNVRYSAANDGADAWANRKDFLVETIKDFNPSLLGTQEVLHDQHEYLEASMPEYKAIGVGREHGKTKGEYSAIFIKKSEFDILDSGTFWLSETPDVPGSKSWKTACTRIVTWAKSKNKAGKEWMSEGTYFSATMNTVTPKSTLT